MPPQSQLGVRDHTETSELKWEYVAKVLTRPILVESFEVNPKNEPAIIAGRWQCPGETAGAWATFQVDASKLATACCAAANRGML